MSYLSLKALHLIGMVCWFAGLFYLPRLFVYHASCEDQTGYERFIVMEQKLYRAIMTPALFATVLFGGIMLLQHPAYLDTRWMQFKLVLVAVLVFYHIACGRLIRAFQNRSNKHSHVFFRWFNEIPTVILIGIIFLAVLRPA